LSTASREPLDDACRQRYCRILVDGCDPQPPSHRPMWSTRIGGPRPRFVFLSIHFLVGDPRDDTSAKQTIGTDCASPQARATDPSTFQNRHRHAATARRLPVVDASAPHSVLPIQCRTSTRNRHRRSTWAGVSWPNNDDIGASGGDNIDRTFARTRTARSTRSVTSLCVLLSERLPVRRRASYSKRNGRATPQRFIEARQHESRHLRALLVGQPA
jgi:hypothetical protein